MRKYPYSDKAENISRIAGVTETLVTVSAVITALMRHFITAAVLVAAAVAAHYVVKRYCTKLSGAALADKIKNNADFAEEFFKENPQLKIWYCPKCRNVYTGGVCGYCGYKKENKGK